MNLTKHCFRLGIPALAVLLSTLATLFAQGPLTPPGAPAPTLKTLQQIEPRTEINAMNTPGDADSSFKIVQPGSYYMSGNLTGVSGKHGIKIQTDNVTLDLNGFALIGIAEFASGITTGTVKNLAIRNGIVRDWGDTGIDASRSSNAIFDRLHLYRNGHAGLHAGGSSSVAQCVAQANLGYGFETDGNCAFTGCSATSNSLNGFELASRSTIAHCTASANGGHGVAASSSCTLAHCTASGNTNNGLLVSSNGTIRDCTASTNTGTGITAADGCSVSGCTANDNGTGVNGGGISTGAGGLVTGCTTRGNKADGIKAGANCTISVCIANVNGSGTTGSGISTDIRAMVRQCSATDNQKNGIVVLGESVVVENRASHNGQGGTAAGIDTAGGSGSRIEGNQTRDNTGTGILASGGDIILRNSAGNNTVANFNPSSGTNFAPIQSPGTATNPLANITF